MITRRQMLAASGALAASPLLGPRPRRAEISVISKESHYYHGWPTIARLKSGRLVLVWSGGREGHVCPFGRVEMMTSDDGGRTWTWPRVILDGPIDDRDAGILETSAGTLLATTFTSLAYEPILQRARGWPEDRLARWKAAHERLPAEERRKELGVWVLRSTDGGRTWSPPQDSLVNSPHGPIQLADGRILYAGKDLWREGARVGVCESKDDGKSWKWLAEISPRAGDDPKQYHELHAVETADGRIVCQIRNHNKANSGETLQCESPDGGKSWSAPHEIGVWGLPSHLLRLRDGRLLMSYGHRRQPFGNQARLSADHGRTWSAPIPVSEDGAGGDLGYPSSVELEDGTIVTAWYELLKGIPRAVLRLARWELPK